LRKQSQMTRSVTARAVSHVHEFVLLPASRLVSALSMPAFQPPAGIKRKLDQCDATSRKKPTVNPSSPQITLDLNGSDEYWMVLWYVLPDRLRCIYIMFHFDYKEESSV
jgi:hypothetical protein